MEYTQIILKEDTRWDTVSYQVYGTIGRISELAEANPTLPLTDLIPQGTKLYIPILEQADISTELLPPWKR